MCVENTYTCIRIIHHRKCLEIRYKYMSPDKVFKYSTNHLLKYFAFCLIINCKLEYYVFGIKVGLGFSRRKTMLQKTK